MFSKVVICLLTGLASATSFADSAQPTTSSFGTGNGFGIGSVIGSVAHIDIMPQDTAKVGDAFKRYMNSAPKEPGALEIRLLQQLGSPNHFTLIEFWSDRKSYDDHLASSSTRDFKRSIAPSLGSPYDERLHSEKLVFAH